MPAIYWIPLPGLDRPAPVEHVHAAFSRWFDEDEGSHHEVIKPYRLSPASPRGDGWGIEVSILTEDAFRALAQHIDAGATVRLGACSTPVGMPEVLKGRTWDDLAAWPGERAWKAEFLTPFIARTRNRATPLPTPAVALRAAIETWGAFSGHPPLRLNLDDQAHVWAAWVELTTRNVMIGRHRFPGALGSITYRADDDRVAAVCSSLFRLSEYSGMGSFRGKGMGIVSVEPQ